jgi:hypothetical protein
MSDIFRQVATIAATLAVIIVSALANYLPINGQTTREISDRIRVYITPAGYVFAIWGVIYLGLIAYTVFQALPMNQDHMALQSIAPYYWLASAANIVWMLLWHYERFPLTPVFMIILLGALIMIYLGLDIGGGAVSAGMRWAVHLPFSIYLGWITVATAGNLDGDYPRGGGDHRRCGRLNSGRRGLWVSAGVGFYRDLRQALGYPESRHQRPACCGARGASRGGLSHP